MIPPPFLQPGDTIGLVAPARKLSAEELRAAVRLIEENGFRAIPGKNILAHQNQLAGSDSQRASDLNDFLADANIKAILCFRGGYGCLRLVDQLKLSHPKWLVGYSDITVLHARMQQQGWQSLHATMPVNMLQTEPERAVSTDALFRELRGHHQPLTLPDHTLNRKGTAEGILVGGNLSVIYSLMGSDLQPTTKGNILFLEDLDEYLYHIDRMMQNLKRAGILKDLAGLVIGGMTDMRDNAIPWGMTAEEIIRSAVEEYDYPMYFGAPAGHIPLNLPLQLGARYRLEENSLGRIE